MIKAGVVSNSDLCLPLLYYLRQCNIDTVFYLGLHDVAADLHSVITFCNSNSIAVEHEKETGQLYGWLNLNNPDFCFVFCYKKLIDVGRVGGFRHRIFNIHPGKLPQYRGPNPVFWQLKNGEATLGITIHFINGLYDAGDIVWSKVINNEPHFSHGLVDYIFSNILVEGVQFVLNTGVDRLLDGKALQDEGTATNYKKPVLKDVLVNWQTMHAAQIVNLVRACNPWNKGAITVCNNMEVKIVDAEALAQISGAPAGTIVEIKDGLQVACSGNNIVRIHSLSINGIFVPARFAAQFGFAAGQQFYSSL
jgi:methionyl-tRNA formyltransferase